MDPRALRPWSHYGETMTTVTVTFTATAKKAVNRSHTKLPFFTLVSNLLRTSFSLYISGLFSSSETYAFRRMVATASFFFLVIPVNSSPERQLLPFSVRIPRCSRFLVLGCHHSLLHLRRSQDTYDYRCRGSHCHIDVHVTSKPCSRSRYETCSVTDKTSPSPSFLP